LLLPTQGGSMSDNLYFTVCLTADPTQGPRLKPCIRTPRPPAPSLFFLSSYPIKESNPVACVKRSFLHNFLCSFSSVYSAVVVTINFASIYIPLQVVGDDHLVTNPKRVQAAIEAKSCNALLLKVNQIGTITESIDAVKMSKEAGWGVMASHRSGETEVSRGVRQRNTDPIMDECFQLT
jgi:hypothetical protein